jgi:DMSO/TMAO reductase YedYZ molybdopterin-dependent catalytic subunit
MIRHATQLTFALVVMVLVFGPGEINAQSRPMVTVGGEVAHQLKLGAADLAKLPHHSIKAREHNGREASFEGVALVDILKLAGVKFGEALRGKDLALYLVVDAADGYRAVFSLAELDPDYNDRIILLADKREGKVLDEKEGPVRIVVAGEKRQARWVSQVVALTIRRAS